MAGRYTLADICPLLSIIPVCQTVRKKHLESNVCDKLFTRVTVNLCKHKSSSLLFADVNIAAVSVVKYVQNVGQGRLFMPP